MNYLVAVDRKDMEVEVGDVDTAALGPATLGHLSKYLVLASAAKPCRTSVPAAFAKRDEEKS